MAEGHEGLNCAICGESFGSRQGLDRHSREEHSHSASDSSESSSQQGGSSSDGRGSSSQIDEGEIDQS